MKKIMLFVTKDLGAAKAAIPVALLAQSEGHDVRIFGEGKSVSIWKEYGFANLDFEGDEFPNGIVSLPRTMLNRLYPDIVVVTQSSPCYLENWVALKVNRKKIPLVFIEDFWAGHRRTKAKPNLVLTLDKVGASLVRSSYGHLSEDEIIIVGNPSVREIIPSNDVIEAVRSLRQRWGRVFLFVGASPEATTAEIALLIGCLEKTKVPWCLVPAFHPKHANAKVGDVTWKDVWLQMLSVFGDRIVSVEAARNSDELAVCCDATFAAHSLTLVSAINNQGKAFSLWTPESQQSLERQVGLDQFPLVSMGLPQIRHAVSLDSLSEVPPGLIKELLPFDPKRALRAILDKA